MASKAIAVPARRWALHDEEFLRAVRAGRVAVLLVHAVNPHGFSYGRRVNEDNVDLNRNFRDFALPAPANAGYADVHPMLLPATWPPPKENEAAIGAYIARDGERAFQAALTGGQYTFPDGLFFGGAGATWSNRTAALGVATACRQAAGVCLDRFSHGPRTARARRKDLCGPQRSLPSWRAPAHGGATTSRRSTMARPRRRTSWASLPAQLRRVSGRGSPRWRSNTGPFRCRRSSGIAG